MCRLYFIIAYFVSICSIYANPRQIEDSYDSFFQLYTKGRYKEAKIVGDSIKDIMSYCSDSSYALFLDKLAECNYELEFYNSALADLKTALKIKKKVFGRYSQEYAFTLHHKATCLSYMGNYKAEILEKRAFNIIRGKVSKYSPTYNRYLLNRVEFIDKDEALSIASDLLPRIDSMSVEFAQALDILADCYYDKGMYWESIRLLNQSLTIRKEIEGVEHPHYASVLNDLAHCYNRINMYPEALSLQLEAKQIFEKSLGESSINTIYSLMSIAVAKMSMGEYYYAKQVLTNVATHIKNKYGYNSIENAYALQLLSNIENKLANYDACIQCQKKSCSIIKKIYGKYDEDYLLGLSNLINPYYQINEIKLAQTIAKEHLRLVLKKYGKNHQMYAYALAHYASVCGDNELSLDLLHKSIAIYSSLGEDYLFDIAGIWEVISDCYVDVDSDKSFFAQMQATSIYKQYDSLCVEYISSVGRLGEAYYLREDIDSSLSTYRKYFNLKTNELVNQFMGLNKYDKNTYWNSFNYAFNFILRLCLENSDNSKAQELAFDMSLFRKGLLLNTEISTRELLAKEDTNLLHMYDDLYNKKIVLNTNSKDEPNEELLRYIKTVENKILSNSSLLSLLRNRLLIKWSDIQNQLSKEDIAIEFELIQLGEFEDIYCALVLKKDYNSPKVIPLFKSTLLDSISFDECYNTNQLSKLIWGPLANELSEVKNIYFSPTGKFYNLSVENLPYGYDGKNELMSDIFNIYRLSSTRNIQSIKEPLDSLCGDIILYGGIEYGIKDENKGLSYLKGSQIEIDAIEKLAEEQCGKICSIKKISGSLGTESSLKDFSGENIKVLHLATHTFCNELESAENPLSDFEDLILIQNGLYMAKEIHSSSLQEGLIKAIETDDGLLNSYEISRLDFSTTDIIVLSACKSGLGAISNDGVFGLQRGFKKAGAHSILMSLWNVDDYSTQLLMTEFYRHYLSGTSKLESLKRAQRYVREYEDEEGNRLFASPSYWAGFILLDALD